MPSDARSWLVPSWQDAVWVHWLAWRNELPWRRPTRVEEGLWLGGVPTERRWRWLRARGVSRFLSVLGEAPPPAWLDDADDGLWLRVPDRNAPTADDLRRAVTFIDNSLSDQHTLFVFCGSGIGRAPTVYLGWRVPSAVELEPAIERLQGLRSIASLTSAQRAALHSWAAQRGLR